MSPRKGKPKKKRDALKPDCFNDPYMFEERGSVCTSCPFFYPCGSLKFGEDFVGMVGANRNTVESHMIQRRVPTKDAIKTIVTLFRVSNNAANLSYGRRKKKLK